MIYTLFRTRVIIIARLHVIFTRSETFQTRPAYISYTSFPAGKKLE